MHETFCKASIGGYWVILSRALSSMGRDQAKVWIPHKIVLFLACWVVEDLCKVLGFKQVKHTLPLHFRFFRIERFKCQMLRLCPRCHVIWVEILRSEISVGMNLCVLFIMGKNLRTRLVSCLYFVIMLFVRFHNPCEFVCSPNVYSSLVVLGRLKQGSCNCWP